MNPHRDTFDQERALFASNVTRTYEWRIEQLDRMAATVGDHEKELQRGNSPPRPRYRAGSESRATPPR